MRNKLLRVLALLLAITLLAAACGSDDDDGGDAGATADGGGDGGDGGGDEVDLPDTFPEFEEPVKGGRLKMVMSDNIDCYSGLSYYGIAWSLHYFMARGLYGYPNTIETPASDEVQADLAADMPEISDDGLTYTVTLREGLKFPDGRPVTAADVKATFEYMLDPNIQCATGGPPSSGYYNVIEGVDAYSEAKTADPAAATGITGITAVDELTTTFKLTEPDGAFLRALAMGWSFIRPADTPHEITETPPLHVGPYKVAEYVADESLKIDREPTWADNVAAGVPEEDYENNIDGIDLEIGVPDDIALARLKDNEIDISYDSGAPVGTDVPDVASDEQYKDRFFSAADSAVDYGIFRTDKEPFNNVELRQAVNWAVDRANVARITGGVYSRTPWSEILSANLMRGSEDENGEVYTFDPDKAREIIEASGVETPIPITMAHFQDAPGPQQAAAVKEALDAVGFDVTLTGLSADVFYGFLADEASDYDIAIAGWGQDYEDAITYFGPLLTCPGGEPTGSNYGRWCDEEFDGRIAEIKAMPVGDERQQAWAEFSIESMKEKAPWWPIMNRRRPLLVSERLGNFIWGTGKQWYFANYFIKDA